MLFAPFGLVADHTNPIYGIDAVQTYATDVCVCFLFHDGKVNPVLILVGIPQELFFGKPMMLYAFFRR